MRRPAATWVPSQKFGVRLPSGWPSLTVDGGAVRTGGT